MKHVVLTLIMIFSLGQSSSVSAQESVVLLELFTSQGCSSCPSADTILEKVDEIYTDQEVIALSYHVDYWDYIGWKDPFSRANYTKKQRSYNIKFRNRSNYTPQLVVNGLSEFAGSNGHKVVNAIDHFKEIPNTNKVSIANAINEHGIISFDYQVSGELEKKWLNVLLVINKRVTEVSRGENRNRTLTNVNVVVNETYSELMKSGKASIQIPEVVNEDDELSLVLITQKSDLEITGAAKVSL